MPQAHPLSAGYAQPVTPIYNGGANFFHITAIDGTGEFAVPENLARRYGVVIMNHTGVDGNIGVSAAAIAADEFLLLPLRDGNVVTPVVVLGQGPVYVLSTGANIEVSGYWI